MVKEMKKVYLAADMDEADRQKLIGHFPQCEFFTEEGKITEVQIIFGNPSPLLVSGCKSLEWLQTCSAGVDPYMAEDVIPKACVLTNATGAYGLAISEHMLAMHLSLIKRLTEYGRQQQEGLWKDLGPVSSIWGSTVLVLGLGDIGGSYSRLVKAMGAYVIGLRRKDLSPVDYADEIHLTADLDSLIPRADVIAIALPGTRDTARLMDSRRIALMKKGAILLNVGRGSVVDTNALCEALKSGAIGGAGLDVTDPEPLPKDHILWSAPGALITPHVSGGYHLNETKMRILKIFAENLERFLRGEPLRNQVDFETGYRRTGGAV